MFLVWQAVTSTLLLLSCSCWAGDGEGARVMQSAVINVGPYFSRTKAAQHGVLVDVRKDDSKMGAFIQYVNSSEPHVKLARHEHGDGESIDSIEKFFWGQDGGVVLELGAVDGILLSQSLPMVTKLGWHRILIEGSPQYRKPLAKNAPEAYVISAAVCSSTRYVHYASQPGSGINGIVEFMDPKFRRKFHSFKDSDSKNWAKSPKVEKIPCLPLAIIFKHIQIQHINYFSLDVEGAELSVLKSINFNAIKFDIISVEIEKAFRPKNHEFEVTQFLRERGYLKIWCCGRNAWFRRKDFEMIARDSGTPLGGCD